MREKQREKRYKEVGRITTSNGGIPKLKYGKVCNQKGAFGKAKVLR